MHRAFFTFLFYLLSLSVPLHGQSAGVEAGYETDEAVGAIEASVRQQDVKMHIYFLAADEFKGRDTGTPHLDIAGRYIATWFMTHGVRPLPGHPDYFQTIPFQHIKAPRRGEIAVGDSLFTFGRDFIILNSPRGEFSGRLAVMDYGVGSELDEQDLEGKIVVVNAGSRGGTVPQQWFASAGQKNLELRERGAVAVVELYDSRQLPWQLIVSYLNQDRLTIDEGTEEQEEEMLPHIWLNNTDSDLHTAFMHMKTEEAAISVIGDPVENVTSSNVVGYIEGTDPDLKDEYLLLGAHYDHVGVVPGQEEGNYIYNGARDNAVGTSAVMLAARYLAENPPKRSVIFAAWTGEEAGLLGSNYFAENPMIPLDRIVYNLNIDGAGYNDTTKVTVIGLERTEAEDDLREAAAAFGLEAIRDPVPEQNLFDRSDNVSFAQRGIPAPTYSLGITAFDEEIEKYYHTVEDEPHTLNYPYITRYIRSFLLAARRIADSDVAPFWREGDVYRQAGVELYGRE